MEHIDWVNCNAIVTVCFTAIQLIILPLKYLLKTMIFKYGENLTKVDNVFSNTVRVHTFLYATIFFNSASVLLNFFYDSRFRYCLGVAYCT